MFFQVDNNEGGEAVKILKRTRKKLQYKMLLIEGREAEKKEEVEEVIDLEKLSDNLNEILIKECKNISDKEKNSLSLRRK